MSKIVVLAATFLALLLAPSASAQSLDRSAAALRDTLASLVFAVKDRVPRDEGRKDINDAIENTRADLDQIRDFVTRGARPYQLNGYVQKSREDFNEMLKRLGKHADRDSIRPIVDAARRDMARYERAWANYQPAVPGFNAPAPVVVSRDVWAQGLAINHLAGFFRVSPTTIQATAVQKSGSRYKVWAQSRKIGAYIVDLDAVTGRVYSATPVGPR